MPHSDQKELAVLKVAAIMSCMSLKCPLFFRWSMEGSMGRWPHKSWRHCRWLTCVALHTTHFSSWSSSPITEWYPRRQIPGHSCWMLVRSADLQHPWRSTSCMSSEWMKYIPPSIPSTAPFPSPTHLVDEFCDYLRSPENNDSKSVLSMWLSPLKAEWLFWICVHTLKKCFSVRAKL